MGRLPARERPKGERLPNAARGLRRCGWRRGVRSRLGAPLGLAVVPLMIGAREAGREILQPVAVSIFGGLVTATLLDAVLTPVLFLLFGRRPLERLMAARDAAAEAGALRPATTF